MELNIRLERQLAVIFEAKAIVFVGAVDMIARNVLWFDVFIEFKKECFGL